MKKNGYDNEVNLTIAHHKNNKKNKAIFKKFNIFGKFKKRLNFI